MEEKKDNKILEAMQQGFANPNEEEKAKVSQLLKEISSMPVTFLDEISEAVHNIFVKSGSKLEEIKPYKVTEEDAETLVKRGRSLLGKACAISNKKFALFIDDKDPYDSYCSSDELSDLIVNAVKHTDDMGLVKAVDKANEELADYCDMRKEEEETVSKLSEIAVRKGKGVCVIAYGHPRYYTTKEWEEMWGDN